MNGPSADGNGIFDWRRRCLENGAVQIDCACGSRTCVCVWRLCLSVSRYQFCFVEFCYLCPLRIRIKMVSNMITFDWYALAGCPDQNSKTIYTCDRTIGLFNCFDRHKFFDCFLISFLSFTLNISSPFIDIQIVLRHMWSFIFFVNFVFIRVCDRLSPPVCVYICVFVCIHVLF